MTVTPTELTDAPTGPTEAESTYAICDAALEAARHAPDLSFPEFRIRTLRRVRSKVEEHIDESGPRPLEPEHVGMMLDLCCRLAPTPHERVEYEAEFGEKHPNLIYGEMDTALRPFYGDAVPDPPARGD